MTINDINGRLGSALDKPALIVIRKPHLTTPDFRNTHSMIKSMCTGFHCTNCNFKTKDYVEVCEMVVPSKCKGMSCIHCDKWAI